MAQFSILVRIHDPAPSNLVHLIESLDAQTLPDWELVLVVSQFRHGDRQLVADLTAGHPKIRVEVRPDDEPLAQSCNALLATLGTWVGFMDQDDWLDPSTLSRIESARLLNSYARVIYTDEENRNAFDHASLRFDKGDLNPARLELQEYIRDLAMLHVGWLMEAGGFDRLASDRPSHDFYLRTLETLGKDAFQNVPFRLYFRRRSYLTANLAPRRRPYMVDYDLHAVRQHFARCHIPATVEQLNGTLEVEYQFAHYPSVLAIVSVDDNTAQGVATLLAMKNLGPRYPRLEVQALYRGTDPASIQEYTTACAGLKFKLNISTDSAPVALNQVALRAETDLLLFLEGRPLSEKWLHHLVHQTQLPDIVATGPRLISPLRITQPGVFGYKYEGWDWNSRGRFNILSIPHQVSALSPACLLVDTRVFQTFVGFDPNYPTLYGMKLTMQLSTNGHGVTSIPGAQVLVQEQEVPVQERERFTDAWAGWKDPYRLHQSL